MEKGQYLSPRVSYNADITKDTSIDADALKLAGMGYAQDMKRNNTIWSVLGIGFSTTNSWFGTNLVGNMLHFKKSVVW
jgi:choline transport protein